MAKYIITEDCLCEHYLHEVTNYPRVGLVKKKLYKGDEVKVEKEWSNFYGTFFRVIKDGIYYDILPYKIKTVSDYTCEDCGIDTSIGNKDYYMVKSHVWEEYGVGSGMLCVECIEERMGHRLRVKDIRDCPVNETNEYIMSITKGK